MSITTFLTAQPVLQVLCACDEPEALNIHTVDKTCHNAFTFFRCSQKNRDLLLGRSMRSNEADAILELLKKDPVVALVSDTKTEEIGPGVFRFKVGLILLLFD